MTDQDLKQLWRTQPVAAAEPATLARVKAEARRMHRAVMMRNRLEYLATAVVVACFGFYVVRFPHPWMRLGSVLVIAGALVVAWQLRRRASAQRLPATLVGQPWIAFRRAQLVRQRDALRSVWRWYLAPLVPGLAVFRWGVETELPGGPFAHGWVANAAIALVFAGIAALNAYAARQMQRRIDALDALAR